MFKVTDAKLEIVRNGHGTHFEIAGARWTWKSQNGDTKDAFCFFEQKIKPGEGVPLHVHSYPEAFYVPEGEIQFCSDDAETVVLCSTGDVVLAQPEVQHTFINRSDRIAWILSVSTGAYQAFFDEIVQANREKPFAEMSPPDAFARVVDIGRRTDTRFTIGPATQI